MIARSEIQFGICFDDYNGSNYDIDLDENKLKLLQDNIRRRVVFTVCEYDDEYKKNIGDDIVDLIYSYCIIDFDYVDIEQLDLVFEEGLGFIKKKFMEISNNVICS